ncbi:sensor histidine kinase [Actinokineospora enzanensis]|uniref:sensor histidine kinase n=1 Tax=Actinokineospora enzanensis TaxID=155975 RepID=UPI0005279CC4|nr:histidine kinase [Actinokineospora enzanensis]
MPVTCGFDVVDVLPAVLLTGLAAAGPAAAGDWPECALAAATVAPLALRGRAPVITTTVVAGLSTVCGLLGYGEPAAGLGLLVGMFTVASLRPPRVAAAMFLVTVLVADHADVQGVLALLGAWLLGEGTRCWGRRVECRAGQAIAPSWVCAARESHEVAAHHLSAISVQAGLARYLLDKDPTSTRQAVDAVGAASREALAELRCLHDILRIDADRAPQPGLAGLADLVRRARTAGLPVHVTITGEVRALPPGLDLCAYRMLQETLGTAQESVGATTAHIDVHYGRCTLTLAVTGTGPGRFETTRRRAALYGGVITAGPTEKGHAVVLRLPLGEVR